MSTGRMRRVDEAVRQVIGDAVAGDLKDPRVGFVTVTDVRTSADLRHARVYVSVLGAAGEPSERRPSARPRSTGLRSAHGYLQARLAGELRLKRTPTLEFVYDETTDRAMRVEQLIDEDGAIVSDTRPRAAAPASWCSQRIRDDERFVLATHENPDGDALGSLVAMQGLLSALGKDSVMFISPHDLPLPREYRRFALDGLIHRAAGRHRRAHRRVPRLRQHRPQLRERAARRRAPAEHRPPPRQHALRHAQPRRARRLLHGGDRLGPDARPRRAARRRRSPRRSTSG